MDSIRLPRKSPYSTSSSPFLRCLSVEQFVVPAIPSSISPHPLSTSADVVHCICICTTLPPINPSIHGNGTLISRKPFAAPHRLQRTSLESNRNSTTLVYNLAYLGSGSRISHWTVGHGITVRLRRQHVTGARSVQNAGFQSGTAAAIVATGTHRVTAWNPVVVWEGGACVLLYNKWMARIRTKFYVDKIFSVS